MTPRSKPEYLYLHVPFCASICSYCDFAHTVYRQASADAWLEAVRKELDHKQINPKLKTIYIGGGTPSSLSEDQLEQLLAMLKGYTSEVIEYTCEVNPETMTQAKAEMMAAYGINRISIGYQCAQDELLKLLGRHHTVKDVQDTVRMFHQAGIHNISLDLMYSLPSQTMEMLEDSIEEALAMEPRHLSLYSLQIEENTVFGRRGIRPLDDETEADMYEYICSVLPEKGYEQYEISNFAVPGFQSLHNRAYWTYRDFYGIGCGASGKEGFKRCDHTSSLKEYLKDPFKTEDIPLNQEDAMFEMVMMNLRLKEGMSLRLFEDTFGITFEEAFRGKYEDLFRQSLLIEKEGMIACSESGYPLLNSILTAFL